MKKQMNGHTISLNIKFWSDYLYGKQLKKIITSNINDVKKVDSSVVKIIEDYKQVYKKLHPVIQTLENDLKYGVIGELLKYPYCVKDRSLFIENGSNSIGFRGENWSIEPLQKKGKKFIDFKDDDNYFIFYNYLNKGSKDFIKTNFPDIFNAVNGNLDRFNIELDSILTFVSTDPFEIPEDTIIDTDKKVKYTIIRNFSTKASVKNTVVDLSSGKISQETGIGSKDFNLYKQDMIDVSNNKYKYYGKEEKITNPFPALDKTLEKGKSLKGLVLQGVLYYETNGDIYQSDGKSLTKIVQNGKIYGFKLKNLLISYKKRLDEHVSKTIIYMLKDNNLDPVNYIFESGDSI